MRKVQAASKRAKKGVGQQAKIVCGGGRIDYRELCLLPAACTMAKLLPVEFYSWTDRDNATGL